MDSSYCCCKVDKYELERIGSMIHKEVESVERECIDLAGTIFNISSSKQVRFVLAYFHMLHEAELNTNNNSFIECYLSKMDIGLDLISLTEIIK